MTIYLAVCDDNIADRKQLERLLEREKDTRLHRDNDVIYIDSFGNKDALISTPVKYDMFIMDVTSGSENAMDIAKELRAGGIPAPIVLMSSSVDYTSFVNAPKDIVFINKPVSSGQVEHLIDVAKGWAAKKPILMEIRGSHETIFIPHEDLIRAIPRKTHVEVALTEGRYIEVPGTMNDFLRYASSYNCFLMCKKVLVNMHQIVGCKDNAMVMSNGESFSYSIFQAKRLVAALANYAGSSHSKESIR